MKRDRFHSMDFDEATLLKLRIFEGYAQDWIDTLANPKSAWGEIHIYDFFAGSGRDAAGNEGTPVLLFRALREALSRDGWEKVQAHLHLFDAKASKVEQLKRHIEGVAAEEGFTRLPRLDIRPIAFDDAFREALPTLCNYAVPCLALIDQFGVKHVDEERFRQLMQTKRTDFIFFLSSETLSRFRTVDCIRVKLPENSGGAQVHRATCEVYRSWVPPNSGWHLAPFSLKKKNGNIYGLVFGAAHPRAVELFLGRAWEVDEAYGEANFDIDGEGFGLAQQTLSFLPNKPTKVLLFERELEQRFRDRALKDELDVLELCFQHGVAPKKCETVIRNLRKEGVLAMRWRLPTAKGMGGSRGRPVKYT